MPWKVLIVEDDPAVATVNRTVVAKTVGFTVTSVVSDAESAARELRRTGADLILLDITLRGADGVSLARRLRSMGSAVEIIPVTAARDAKVVRALLHLGAVDYLVKPFTPERLRQALIAFRERMRSLDAPVDPKSKVTQGQVDLITGSSGGRRVQCLPKGIDADVLASVREVMGADVSFHSAAEIAQSCRRARVTVRRYLEYLVATEQAEVESLSSGPGRPTKVYRLTAG